MLLHPLKDPVPSPPAARGRAILGLLDATAASTMISPRTTPRRRGQKVFETKMLGPSPKRKHWTTAPFTSITEPPRGADYSILRR